MPRRSKVYVLAPPLLGSTLCSASHSWDGVLRRFTSQKSKSQSGFLDAESCNRRRIRESQQCSVKPPC